MLLNRAKRHPLHAHVAHAGNVGPIPIKIPTLHLCVVEDMKSIREMRAEVAQLAPLIEAAREKEVPALLADFKVQVDLYRITETEILTALGFLKPTRPRAAAQYYDPTSGKSWSGRGKRPKWLIGKNLSDYLIRDAAQPWWPGERKRSEPKPERSRKAA